jgi:hypothetical protein
LQWLQDPSEINGDNMNNARHEAGIYFRNKKREYMKDKINEIATNSKNKNISDLYRRIHEFMRGYQPRNKLVKAEYVDLLEDYHNILNRWKNYFSQLLNMQSISDVKQIEVYTAEPLIPGPSRLEVQITVVKLKKYKAPGSGQISAELIQAGSEILLSAIHKLINSVWNKGKLPDQWRSPWLYQFTKRVTKLTVIIVVGYHCYQLHTTFYRICSSQG